jgi:hypothetical protein
MCCFNGSTIEPTGRGGVLIHTTGDTWGMHVGDIGDGNGTALYVCSNSSDTQGARFGYGEDAVNGYLARWDGSRWTAVATGLLTAPCFDCHRFVDPVRGPELIVVGEFTVSPGNRIIATDGEGFFQLGTGLGGSGFALEQHTPPSGVTGMYVGGSFATAGGVGAANIAVWEGSVIGWSPLGAGVNGAVNSVISFGTNLVVGGSFTTAGGNPALRVAMWDGSAWSAMGNGFSSPVFNLAIHNGDLYACGAFATSGATVLNGVARWNGADWVALGTGLEVGVGAQDIISADVGAGQRLYAVGGFQTAGGVDAWGMAQWNGSAWSAVIGDDRPGIWSYHGISARATPYDVVEFQNCLVTIGDVDGIGGTDAAHIARGQATV